MNISILLVSLEMCTRCVQKLTSFVGDWLGLIDGAFDGDNVGISVGDALGEALGLDVGC